MLFYKAKFDAVLIGSSTHPLRKTILNSVQPLHADLHPYGANPAKARRNWPFSASN
jgi:hypothetical protein